MDAKLYGRQDNADKLGLKNEKETGKDLYMLEFTRKLIPSDLRPKGITFSS